tara:strand:+ start:9367 stop:12372 length:3006 start_codon:yes stop_codon:yes gene_type:complete
MSKKVELIIGVYPDQVSLDLNEDAINIALQYSIDDVRNIENINSNHSKTISLPGTKKNNIAFGGLFDVNSTFDKYNPNLRKPARIVVDSSPILEGYLQLTSIKKLNNTDLQGNKISYEVVVFDDSIDFIQSLGDKNISDLDFSALNHTYGKTAIEDAWLNNTFSDVFQYPMLDKNTEGYETEDFKPAFYHKGLLLKIAEDSDYTLEGDFIENNAQYEREIIAWDGNIPTIKESEAINREFKAGYIGVVSGKTTLYDDYHTTEMSLSNFFNDEDLNFRDITSSGLFDNTGGYTFDIGGSLGYSQWDTTKAGRYNFNANFIAGMEYYGRGVQRNASGTQIVSGNTLKARVRLIDVTTGYVLSSRTQNIGSIEALTVGSSTATKVTKNLEAEINVDFNDVQLSQNQKVGITVTLINDVNNSSSEKFAWTTGTGLPYNTETVRLKMYVKDTLSSGATSSFSNKVLRSTNINDGDEVELSLYLPKDIKQKDLLTDIIKRYNVYIRKHPTKYKTLILETRDYFYNNNTKNLDWTQKKDYNTEDKTQFLSELQNKEVLFTYKEAEDITASDSGKYNEAYNLSTGDIYGQKKIGFNNDFVSGVKRIESIFSTTPLVYRGLSGNNVVVPSMKSSEGKRKPVLLYWGGLTTIQDENGNASNVKITFGTNAQAEYTAYPYAGHYDNPYNPTLDIHFGSVSYEYYGVLLNSVTDRNLFNDYWRNYYNQITEGKLVTSSFYLNETDIAFIKDNLNTRIFIKDSYYIINKIIDYKPLEDGLTKVELLQIDKGTTFEPTIGAPTVNFTAIDQIISIEGNGLTTGPSRSNITNRSLSANSSIVGSNNTVGANSVAIVNGNNNVVSGDSVGVSVTGSNNFVSSGLSNVTIVGDNISVRESNTTVIGDLVIQDGKATGPSDVIRVKSELGIWDMGTDSFVIVSHSLSATEYLTIDNIDISIYPDSLTSLAKLVGKDLGGLSVTINDFLIKRVTGGHFTGTNYGNNTNNRGFISYDYTPD